MSKQKSNKFTEVFKIFFSSLKIYFLYLDQFLKYLAFPVFGQLLCIFIIFTLTYFYSKNYEYLYNLNPFFHSGNNLYIIFWVILIPFLIVLIRAAYKYIIAFESLNIVFSMVNENKKVKNIDFALNDRAIERRLFGYVLLMLFVTLILILPALVFKFPLILLVISPILWIYLCLSFQVHALETDTSAFQAIVRSFKLVKGNVFPTIILMVLCIILTYWFITSLFIWALDKISVTHFFINLSIPFLDLIYQNTYNNIMNTIMGYESVLPKNIYNNLMPDTVTMAKMLVESVINSILIAFTLPFRCCCFTKLYKLYDSEQIKEISKESDEIIKRATGRKRKN